MCAVKIAGDVSAYSDRVRVEFSVDADGSSLFGSEVNLFEEDPRILTKETKILNLISPFNTLMPKLQN